MRPLFALAETYSVKGLNSVTIPVFSSMRPIFPRIMLPAYEDPQVGQLLAPGRIGSPQLEHVKLMRVESIPHLLHLLH